MMKQIKLVLSLCLLIALSTQAQLSSVTGFGNKILSSTGTAAYKYKRPLSNDNPYSEKETNQFQKWEGQSLTVSTYSSSQPKDDTKNFSGIKAIYFFEDIDTKATAVKQDSWDGSANYQQYFISVALKAGKSAYCFEYDKDMYREQPITESGSFTRIYFNTNQAATDGLKKLNDAIFDAALDLDAKVVRPDIKEIFFYNQQYPNGIAHSKYLKNEETADAKSNAEIRAQQSSSSSSSNTSESGSSGINTSQSFAPKQKIEATIELRNRSKASVEIVIKAPAGSSKNTFSINASSSKKERIKVGSSIFVNGSLALTVTADMDGESKIIAQ